MAAPPRDTPIHDHRFWRELDSLNPAHDTGDKRWPAVRAVISGDVITFSIEVDHKLYDSYRLAGDYRSPFFPPPGPEARAASNERFQYGAIKLRSMSCPSLDAMKRAADYGADVLRRRGESLADQDKFRLERVGDNNHLVLFVRNSFTGKVSSLGVTAAGQKEIMVIPQGPGDQAALPHRLPGHAIPSPWLVPAKVCRR